MSSYRMKYKIGATQYNIPVVDDISGFGSGVPLGTILPYPANSEYPPEGFLFCDGSAVSRTAYPDLFALIGTTYGSWDNSTTFNLPDLGFLDGDTSTVIYGDTFHDDTKLNMNSTFSGKQVTILSRGPALGYSDETSFSGASSLIGVGGVTGDRYYPLYANLSSAVSNKVCYIIKAFSATSSNSELVDVTELSTEITKKFDPRTDYTIIYPNNGTESNPAELSSNARYVESNPFPGYAVKCAVEYYMTGFGWGETTWICVTTSVSRGTVAFQLDDGDIVVQTANGDVCHAEAWYGGTPFGNSASGFTRKCRIKVWKIGKLPSQSP